jgi:hypothetical protein
MGLSGFLKELHHRNVFNMARQCADELPLSATSIGEGYFALGDFEQAINWWSRAAERRQTYALTVVPARDRNHPVVEFSECNG